MDNIVYYRLSTSEVKKGGTGGSKDNNELKEGANFR